MAEDATLEYAEKLMKVLDTIEKAVEEARDLLVNLTKNVSKEEYDGWYNKDEEGFECAFEGCEDWIWDTPEELIEHLRKEHGIEKPKIDYSGFKRDIQEE